MRFLLLILSALALSVCANGQTLKYLDKMDSRYQDCLDKGVDMYGCSVRHYEQMDSMLNYVYRSIRAKMDSTQKSNLKSQQLAWLKKRDQYFKETVAEAKKEFEDDLSATDVQMVYTNKQAVFVKKRVADLLKTHGDVPLPGWAMP
jgi:uncharacterized protein YecT (DUF1311 family)